MTRAVSKPQLSRAIAAFEAAGKTVKGLLCNPDGSIAVLLDAPAVPELKVDADDWLNMVGDEARGSARG